MRYLVVLMAFLVAGCANIGDRKALEQFGLWPSRNKNWCHPDVRYNHERKRTRAGVRCYW